MRLIIRTLNEAFERTLQNIYYAEKVLSKAPPKMADLLPRN
jgi:ferritin-like metal-binding protein YciE